jgi:hypothetical protein
MSAKMNKYTKKNNYSQIIRRLGENIFAPIKFGLDDRKEK